MQSSWNVAVLCSTIDRWPSSPLDLDCDGCVRCMYRFPLRDGATLNGLASTIPCLSGPELTTTYHDASIHSECAERRASELAPPGRATGGWLFQASLSKPCTRYTRPFSFPKRDPVPRGAPGAGSAVRVPLDLKFVDFWGISGSAL